MSLGDAIVQLWIWVFSPEIQQELMPAKIVFIFFAFCFVVFLIYLMVESSYLYYHVYFDLMSFFTWRSPAAQRIFRQWQ